MELHFPDNFLWGAATSAHQVEGDNINSDWWVAERERRVPHKSGKACNSYHMYEADFDLAASMNNNAHRLSIEWARIEPVEGKFNNGEIEHYRKVLLALKARGLEPFVTLHHFTNPQWFAARGGWKNNKAPEYFERYVRYVTENLGDNAHFWITINEPLIVSSAGYLEGRWPPFRKRDIIGYWRALKNMSQAHKRAYQIIKAISPKSHVGIAKNINYFESQGGLLKPLNKILVKIADYHKNFWFLNAINDYQDFIGLNYYNHYKVSVTRGFYQEGKLRSDFGWEIYPEGIYHTALSLQKFNKPIYITENGISDKNDDKRPWFIRENLLWLHKAIEKGVDVRGYFYWSLLDNFEWSEGFEQKFGLVEVDFDTFKRTPRGSCHTYKEICENNQLTN